MEEATSENESMDSSIFVTGERSMLLMCVEVEINHKRLTMEIDIKAAHHSQATQQKLLPKVKLYHSSIVLKTYMSERLKVLNKFSAEIKYEHILTLLVIWT